MSEQANPQVDIAGGMRSKLRKAAPQIDLAAGLIAKKKPSSKIDLSAGLMPREESAAPGKSAAGGVASGKRGPARNAPLADSSLAGAGQPGNQYAQTQAAPPPKPLNPLRDVVRRVAAANEHAAAEAPRAHQEKEHVLAVDGTPQGTWQPAAPSQGAAQSEFDAQNQRMPQSHPDPVPEPRQPLRGREPQREPAAPAAYAAPRHEPAAPSQAQPWERAPRQREEVQPESDFAGSGIYQQADPQYNAATRMTGLRNLIQTLGMKTPPPEAFEQAAQASRPPEPVQPRPVYPRTPPPMPQPPAWNNVTGASPTLVTAPPEFLPPRPMVEKEEKERSSSNNSTRRDRRDTYDDVEILPSWRGQYKRK